MGDSEGGEGTGKTKHSPDKERLTWSKYKTARLLAKTPRLLEDKDMMDHWRILVSTEAGLTSGVLCNLNVTWS